MNILFQNCSTFACETKREFHIYIKSYAMHTLNLVDKPSVTNILIPLGVFFYHIFCKQLLKKKYWKINLCPQIHLPIYMHNFFRIELRVRQVPSTATEYNLSIHFLFMIPLSCIMMDYSCYQGGVTQYNTMVNNAFPP